MRFVSKYARYILNVRRPITEYYATGQSKEVQRALVAQFDVAVANADERAQARQRFSFNGFAQEQDKVTIVEPDARISGYDTRLAQIEHGWSDEERELVEEELLKEVNRLPEDLFLVEEIRALPPWPTYDHYKGNAKQLIRKIEEDGFDFGEVLVYERENLDRPEVVDLLQEAIAFKGDGLAVHERILDPEETLVG